MPMACSPHSGRCRYVGTPVLASMCSRSVALTEHAAAYYSRGYAVKYLNRLLDMELCMSACTGLLSDERFKSSCVCCAHACATAVGADAITATLLSFQRQELLDGGAGGKRGERECWGRVCRSDCCGFSSSDIRYLTKSNRMRRAVCTALFAESCG